MTHRIASYFKTTLSVLILATLTAFVAQGIFSGALQAQPGEDPNYQYPVLQDKDFQMFLNLISYIEQDKDPATFYQQNNVTEEYAQAVVMKISINTMAILMGEQESLQEEFGESIIFSASEESLYKKYEDRIMGALVQLGAKAE
jgi:hypothetical protein